MLSLFCPFQVFSTSMGLTKTVYNPAALKAAQKNSEEALKKKQVREEMEGIVGKGEWMDSKVRPQSDNDMRSKRLRFSYQEQKAVPNPINYFTGSSKTTARCKEEEAGNIGKAH